MVTVQIMSIDEENVERRFPTKPGHLTGRLHSTPPTSVIQKAAWNEAILEAGQVAEALPRGRYIAVAVYSDLVDAGMTNPIQATWAFTVGPPPVPANSIRPGV